MAGARVSGDTLVLPESSAKARGLSLVQGRVQGIDMGAWLRKTGTLGKSVRSKERVGRQGCWVGV